MTKLLAAFGNSGRRLPSVGERDLGRGLPQAHRPHGKTLYIAQNQLNLVAKIALASNLRSGRVVRRSGKPPHDFDIPTTLALHGSRLYAVNARFGTTPTPTTDYWITQLKK